MTTKPIALQVPFHRADIGEEEIQAVTDVLRSGWLTMGARTFELERKFAAYVGAEHAVAVSSCTAALHLALEAAGIGPGDEVLVPTTTFTATAEAVTYCGGRPVLVDIDAKTLNIDPADVARRLTGRTRAIIPVHFGGMPCDMEEITELAGAHNLHVIEDAAHSLPASYRGKKIGAISDLTAFSFYATKTLTTGEGGMITTNNADYARRMQMMRLHGIERDAWKRYSGEGSWFYEVREMGFKYNLTDMQAALGIVQLAKCDTMNAARARIAQRYGEAFRTCDAIEIPAQINDRATSWHLYVLRLNLDLLRIGRDRFIRELAERGVGTSVHFIPLHLQPAYQRTFHYEAGNFPVAEREYERSFSLPIFSAMREEEIEQVVWAVLDAVSAWRR